MSEEPHTSEQGATTATAALGRTQSAWLAGGALAVASVPHFFLQTPLSFYEQANTSSWLGLTVWAPTFLAAVALFVGAETSARVEKPLLPGLDLRMAAGVTGPIAVLVALAALNLQPHSRVGSWTSLALAMCVYAGVFAVGAFYWQAFVQREILSSLPQLLRPLVVAALGVLLWLPFLFGHSTAEVGELLVEHAIVYLGIALLFECGLPVYACMASAALMGAAYAWSHQMIFF